MELEMVLYRSINFYSSLTIDFVSIIWKQLTYIWGKSLLYEGLVFSQLLLPLSPPKKEGKLMSYFPKVTQQIRVENHEMT